MQSSEARIHCLSNRLKNTTKNNDAVLSSVNERHEKQKAAMKKKHDAMLLEMKQQHEKRMKDKEDELEEAKENVETISDGLCENLRAPNDVDWEELAGTKAPPSMDIDSPEYKEWLRRSKAARKPTGRNWKDDYLAYSIYLRSGATQEFVACLCGISSSRMSEILHEWTQVLDKSLQRWFPTPTRSQVLRAYPQPVICCTNVASTTHSDYKKHCTVKFLAACGIIGEVPAEWVPDGRGGRASDVMMTDHTNILRFVPYGHTCKVDKGFIVNLIAAREGVIQTQKIGNTRIIVENVNGGVKTDNFKKPLVQHVNPDLKADGNLKGIPCRAAVRWGGAECP
eukprot:scaffold6122_cov167-Skeletonema_marinoi.AAC.1